MMLSALFDRPDNERAVGSVPWSVANDDGWGVWPGETAGTTWAGQNVDRNTAPQLLAVYGSASLITDEISTLPVNTDDAPMRPAWVDDPTEGLDRVAWVGQIVWSLLLDGNAYIAVFRAANRRVVAMDPLDPGRVRPRRENGRKVFYIDGQRAPFEVVHIPGRMRPGDLTGMSPIEWCRQTIGLGLASTKYGAEFFDGEGNMPGVIEAPHAMQPDTMRNLATQWRKKRGKGGRGLPGVLQAGATWKPTGVTNEQAQFLATRKWTAAEICGQIFLLDPNELGIPVEGSNLTYTNQQSRIVSRLRTVMPWVRRIETALTPLVPGGPYRFDVDSRLRGNTRESYETLGVAIKAGFMSREEARIILGLDGPAPVLEDIPNGTSTGSVAAG